MIRTDNGPEFAWQGDARHGPRRNRVELRFIQPGKPVQNAYIESFNSRFRDECLSQHWFASLSHMRSVIDNWRDDYNHYRPPQHARLRAAGRRSPRGAASSLTAPRNQPCINYDAKPWDLDRSATKLGGSADWRSGPRQIIMAAAVGPTRLFGTPSDSLNAFQGRLEALTVSSAAVQARPTSSGIAKCDLAFAALGRSSSCRV